MPDAVRRRQARRKTGCSAEMRGYTGTLWKKADGDTTRLVMAMPSG